MQAAGFIKGRPKALFVLDYGLFKVHANHRVIGICGFLIQTDADEYILIDTGFPAKYTTDPVTASCEDALDTFGEVLICGPENLPQAQLAKIGINADDITLQIVTHSHIDHIGGMAAFPDAPIVIAAAERALPRPLYWGDVRVMTWPDRRYLKLCADVSLGPDLTVLLVPGHAPGQLAVLLTLPDTGSVLLTSDAISRPEEINQRFGGSWDETLACESGDRLMALAQASEAMVIYGHCPLQWRSLRKAPLGYT